MRVWITLIVLALATEAAQATPARYVDISDGPGTGVRWGHKVFRSPDELASWLSRRGASYEAWAQRHPYADARLTIPPRRAPAAAPSAERASERGGVRESFGGVAVVVAAALLALAALLLALSAALPALVRRRLVPETFVAVAERRVDVGLVALVAALGAGTTLLFALAGVA